MLLEGGYQDIYLSLNEGVEGATMLKNKHETTWRPDKIIVPSSMIDWQATSIKIVGKFSIPTFSKDAPELLEQDG